MGHGVADKGAQAFAVGEIFPGNGVQVQWRFAQRLAERRVLVLEYGLEFGLKRFRFE